MPTLRRSIRDLALFLVGRRTRFVVAGTSMLPTLKPHESIFINTRHYAHSKPQSGEIVLVQHPEQDLLMIKRIAWVKNESVFVMGDNPNESTDSRHFGAVRQTLIVGLVSSKL